MSDEEVLDEELAIAPAPEVSEDRWEDDGGPISEEEAAAEDTEVAEEPTEEHHEEPEVVENYAARHPEDRRLLGVNPQGHPVYFHHNGEASLFPQAGDPNV